MNRTQKLRLNTFFSLLNRVCILCSGLILPRLILVHYGSETNGILASINQFLNIITFLDLGIGAVVQSELYKPLANRDAEQINSVMTSAKNYFKKIGYIIFAYIIILMYFYPLIVNQSMNYISTAFLIFAISISLLSQYFLGIVNEILLDADQRSYVQLFSEIVVILLNLFLSIFLIHQGASIQVVKLGASLVYLIRPIYLAYYVKKHYTVNKNIKLDRDYLPQKWNGIAQHIAYTVQNSTDIFLITLFATLKDVSIYSIYNMVISTIRMIITSLSTGLKPFFGNLLARKEMDLLNDYFAKIEWLIHTIVIFLFGVTSVLINPFVLLYTSGVGDINYSVPLFSFLMVIAGVIYSIRTPYRMLILAAGHFKQTQFASIAEATINLIISTVLIGSLGLPGVVVGTIFAMTFYIIYVVLYLSKHLINRPINYVVKLIIVDISAFAAIYLTGRLFLRQIIVLSFLEWIIFALIISFVALIILILINVLFYKDMLRFYLCKLYRKSKNK